MMGPMGWAGGSLLFNAVINGAKRYIKDPKARRKFYLSILPAFNDDDWDTQGECQGEDPVFDKILFEQGYVESVRDTVAAARDDFANDEDDEPAPGFRSMLDDEDDV